MCIISSEWTGPFQSFTLGSWNEVTQLLPYVAIAGGKWVRTIPNSSCSHRWQIVTRGETTHLMMTSSNGNIFRVTGHLFASDREVRNGQSLSVIQGKYFFLWTMASNSLTENEEQNIPSHILKITFGLHASVIFQTQICVFSSTFEGSWDPRS